MTTVLRIEMVSGRIVYGGGAGIQVVRLLLSQSLVLAVINSPDKFFGFLRLTASSVLDEIRGFLTK